MTELQGNTKSKASRPPGGPPAVDQAYVERLRELKLELEKTRSQASAARLDARAAELELRIQRLESGIHEDADADPDLPIASAEGLELQADPPVLIGRVDKLASAINELDQVEDASRSYYVPSLPRHRPLRSAQIFQRSGDGDAPLEASIPGIESWEDFRSIIRLDSTYRTPELPSWAVGHRTSSTQDDSSRKSFSKTTSPQKSSSASRSLGRQAKQQTSFSNRIDLATNHDAPRQRRRKPAAWVWSAVFHLLILVFLAFFTLSVTKPGDQVAIAGSITEADEVAIESLKIEAAEIQPAESEPTPSEMEYEISEIGQVAITELVPDALLTPPVPLLDSMMQNPSPHSASMSLHSDSDATIKFCGLEGGGNHFVYLVDSSGSMGSAFESARTELLRSIDVLKPDQRFYVIFFDSESDYMRLTSPDHDEPRSVYATPESKRALRRWAMTISMDRGRAPYDALPFAIDLAPDVIFLLSDGEFPKKIEDLLTEINWINNLFGDERLVSIVHTIGYHSREGESRMRKIANQNGGQYRHVPKP